MNHKIMQLIFFFHQQTIYRILSELNNQLTHTDITSLSFQRNLYLTLIFFILSLTCILLIEITFFLGCSWVHCTSDGPFPPNMVRGGIDRDGTPIFIGRAFHEGDMIPGKIKDNFQLNIKRLT